MTMTGNNTQVSDVGMPIGGAPVTSNAAPGAQGPGGQMGITPAVIWTIGGAAAALVAIGYVFRKGEKALPPIRVDAINMLNVYFSWLVVNGTVKILCYRYHGHKLAQAYLLVA
jgi:hypothetical protein